MKYNKSILICFQIHFKTNRILSLLLHPYMYITWLYMYLSSFFLNLSLNFHNNQFSKKRNGRRVQNPQTWTRLSPGWTGASPAQDRAQNLILEKQWENPFHRAYHPGHSMAPDFNYPRPQLTQHILYSRLSTDITKV